MSRRHRVRLGPDFNHLLAANVSSNLGDGVRLAAGPLLTASVTTDPVLVGAALFVQQLPWLLASLMVGAWVDRLDRRRVVLGVDIGRTVLAMSLAAAVATGTVTVELLYAVLFITGVTEVIADSASSALVPAVVADEHLPRANARLSAAFTVGNQFTGPPLGAWLFTAGAAWPFGLEAATFATAALLLARIRHGSPPEATAPHTRGWLRRDVAEGVVWLWRTPSVRLLALVLAVMNVTFSSAFATWVLFAHQRLGVSGAGFGLLLTASAAGALAGAGLTGWLTDRLGSAVLLRAGLVVETCVLAVLATTTNAWVAGAVMVAFGAHAAVWGVVASTVRQRLVPDRLRGRVGSVYFLLVMGGSALGALVGGFLARGTGLAGPFRVAAAGDTVLLLLVWRRLGAAAMDQSGAPSPAAPTGQSDEGPNRRHQEEQQQ